MAKTKQTDETPSQPPPAEPTGPSLRERAASLAWDPDELRTFLVDLTDAVEGRVSK